MTVRAVVSTPTGSFPLAFLFETDPEARIKLERSVPLAETTPFLWVTGADAASIRAAADRCEAVRDVTVLQSSEASLVGVEWASTNCFLGLLIETDVTCLRGTGAADGWRFHLRFPDRETLATCYQRCEERDLSLQVESVRSPANTGPRAPDDALTPGQREALTVALEAGYFGVPREAALVDVAADLGVSDTAASQRLRRGVERLLRESLMRER
jgi:predicted DNA binding protein